MLRIIQETDTECISSSTIGINYGQVTNELQSVELVVGLQPQISQE